MYTSHRFRNVVTIAHIHFSSISTDGCAIFNTLCFLRCADVKMGYTVLVLKQSKRPLAFHHWWRWHTCMYLTPITHVVLKKRNFCSSRESKSKSSQSGFSYVRSTRTTAKISSEINKMHVWLIQKKRKEQHAINIMLYAYTHTRTQHCSRRY